MHHYTVTCEFEREEVAAEWLRWLRDEHVQDVLDAGAERAEIVKMEGPGQIWQIRYYFPSHSLYENYINKHHDRLQSEGLERFPKEMGLQYDRTNGEIVAVFPEPDGQ